MLAWQPLLPAWGILLAGGLAVAAAVAVYRRPSLPSLLRVAALMGVLLMLANPVRQEARPVSAPPVLAIAVDVSGSMATADAGDGRTRGQRAREAATDLARRLGGTWRVVVTGFAAELASPVPGRDEGDSDFSGLAGLADLTPRPTAAIVISDGADWAGADPETPLAAAGIPLHAVGVGSSAGGANLALRLQVPNSSLAPGQEVPLTVEVTASPGLVGRTVQVTVAAIEADGERPLLSTAVTLAPWQRVPVTDQAGTALGGRLWRATVTALPEEITTLDNTAWGAAQVVDRSLRILVLEGSPGWDTTFLVRAWRRDRQLHVDSVYALGKQVWNAGEVRLPLAVGDLQRYDVLALGANVAKSIPGGEEMRTWLDHGGRLLLLGTEAQPTLGELDPLELQGQAQPLTITGGRDGLLPADAEVTALVAPATPRPQTLVPLGTRDRPVIGLRRIGAGAVLRLNLDGLWRWHLGRPGRDEGERFGRQVLRLLAKAPAGDLWTERLRLAVGEQAAIRIRPDAGITAVQHRRPDGRIATLAVDGSGVHPLLDEPGVHRFSADGQSLAVVVEPRLGELVNAARNDNRLGRLAERTGGTFRDIAETAALAERLTARRVLAGSAVRSDPLIAERWWLLGLLAILGGEWWIRRRTHGVV